MSRSVAVGLGEPNRHRLVLFGCLLLVGLVTKSDRIGLANAVNAFRRVKVSVPLSSMWFG
jgi:hypothetical protein